MQQIEMPELGPDRQWVQSMTDPEVYYEVDTKKKTCTCPAWKRGMTRPCKHLKEVMPELRSAEGLDGWKMYSLEKDRTDMDSPERQEKLSELRIDLSEGFVGKIGVTGEGQEAEKQVESWLQERVEAGLDQYSYVPTKTRLKEKNRKWAAVSCLQKAIRRGNPVLAKRMGVALLKENAWYAMNRLAVIMPEDIGIGDVVLNAEYLWALKQGKEWWAEHDREKVYAWFVERSARTLKSRYYCDVMTIWDNVPEYEWTRELEQWNDMELWALTKQDDPIPAVKAAWILMRQEYEGKKRHWKNIAKLLEGADPLIRYVTMTGLFKIRDAMPISLPYVWKAFAKSKELYVRNTIDIDTGMVGHFLAASIDQHVADGKRAISYWSKVLELPKLYDEWGVPDDKRFSLTGLTLFRIEGDRVDAEVCYDDTEKRTRQWIVGVMKSVYPLTDVQCDELIARMTEGAESLHYVRRKMLGLN